jgi:two-component system response regulator HydG
MPNLSGLDLLRAVKQRNPAMEVIMMTGSATIETALEAVRNGAYEYVTKPFDRIEDLIRTVEKAAERHALLGQNRALRKLVDQSGASEIVGESAALRQVLGLVESVARSTATVLITGESGTGKEVIARAIHQKSPRHERPFVAVNCSALTDTLLESELFGHVKGAFTGAMRDKKGLFEAAEGGTLFLDEIGDVPLPMQVKLLRAIQQGEVKPVGANETRKVDVRILAATNVDLQKAVAQARFREDLYYRLAVIPVRLPPLRDRPEDIAKLAYHFMRRHSARHGRKIDRISDKALEILRGHAWPGNVRELENLMERVVLLSQTEEIAPEDLPPELGGSGPVNVDPSTLAHLPFNEAKQLSVRAFERRYLAAVLDRHRGKISPAARDAGMDRSNFRRLMKQAGLYDPAGGEGDEADEVV